MAAKSWSDLPDRDWEQPARALRTRFALEQRVKRAHGESFDQLLRQARKAHEEQPLAATA